MAGSPEQTVDYSKMNPAELLNALGMDGKLWADVFMQMWGHRLDKVDHSIMIGWFANAIMAGYDRRTNP